MARHDANERSRGTPAWRGVRKLELPDTPLSTRGSRRAEEPRPPRAADDAGRPPQPSEREKPASEKQERRKSLWGRETWPRRRKRAPLPPLNDDAFAAPPPVPETPPESSGPGARAEQAAAGTDGRDEAVPPEKTSAPTQEQASGERSAAPRPRTAARRTRTEPPRPPETLGKRVARFLIGLLILAGALGIYQIWARQSKREALPPMFMPQPYYYEEEQPVHAVILWREKLIQSPSAGTVQLAFGQKPSAVAAGDVVATVLGRGKGTPVRVPGRGYFLPALDGAADTWEYSRLWIGSGLLPEAPPLEWIKDLAPLDASRAVGRLITLPQAPRAIFYLNLTDTLRAALERGVISIRRQSRGPKWASRVRVYNKYSEQRAKVCIEMPYFPLDMVLSRTADFLVCSDEDSGLLVPDSAVTIRNGTYGVFELVGDQLIFRSVTGKPARDGMFFISSGLSPGNPVIVNAANAEEKRVRLW